MHAICHLALFQAVPFLSGWQREYVNIVLCVTPTSFHSVNIFVCQHYVLWYTLVLAPFSENA